MTARSETFQIGILPTIDADGPTQMGMDLALLDCAEETPTTIWFRTYTWSVPTLSLGYFQLWKERTELISQQWSQQAVVRRPTGGGAIWHDQDLTYSIVIPSRHPWATNARKLYQSVHDSLALVMLEDGAAVKRRQLLTPNLEKTKEQVANEPTTISPFLCFDDRDADDLILSGHKIVGGAQRKRGWATLQHGSIHWRRSSHPSASHLPGLIDLSPNFSEKSHIKWSQQLGRRLAENWQIPAESVNFPAEVLLAAHGWSNRIRGRDWLEKR